MDELKLLVDMVSKLPTLAVWVIVAFYAYKVMIIGSIYGVIRFGIAKVHDMYVAAKTPHKPWPVEMKLFDKCISEATAAGLREQIARVMSTTGYIHDSNVSALREAIDDYKKKKGLT